MYLKVKGRVYEAVETAESSYKSKNAWKVKYRKLTLTLSVPKDEPFKCSESIVDLCDKFMLIDNNDYASSMFEMQRRVEGTDYGKMHDEFVYRINNGADISKLTLFGLIESPVMLSNGMTVYKSEPVAILNEHDEMEMISYD